MIDFLWVIATVKVDFIEFMRHNLSTLTILIYHLTLFYIFVINKIVLQMVINIKLKKIYIFF